MSQIPFILGSNTGRSTNINAQRCINLFPAIDPNQAKSEVSLYGTPGFGLFSALITQGTYTSVRAMHIATGPSGVSYLYVICGNKVYYVTSAGIRTAISGNIDTSVGFVYMSSNMRDNDPLGSEIMIVDGSEFSYYIYNNTLIKMVYVEGAYATGTITVSGIPVADETFVVGTQTFKFVASRVNTGEVTISANNTDQATNINFAINTDISNTVTAEKTMAVVSLTAKEYGIDGNSIILTEAATGIAVSGSGTLSGGVDDKFNLPSNINSVAYQDGYFIVSKLNTGEIYISTHPNDITVWDLTDMTIADSNPDYALRIMSSNRELWVFGNNTIEPYYNSGNVDFPFERIQGSVLELGTIAPASITRIEGIFLWLSDKKRVAKNTGYQVQYISSPTIDYQISTYSKVDDAIGCSCSIEGHDWYVLSFPTENKTWVYDLSTDYWFEWESYNSNIINPFGRHRINCSITFANKQIIGDYASGDLFYLDMDSYTDNTNEIRRYRTSQVISNENKNIIFHELQLEFESGVGISGVTYDYDVDLAPEILLQPVSVSVNEGEDATFTTLGCSTGTLFYQWYHGVDVD
ncbi:hypothetical protein M0R04_09495 [Candidatus Dojkabacteria bacterium]|jgi:hypothetical protein|nr:hypothetical protein [Candidatus Dojkabacteria bacterium]